MSRSYLVEIVILGIRLNVKSFLNDDRSPESRNTFETVQSVPVTRPQISVIFVLPDNEPVESLIEESSWMGNKSLLTRINGE